MISWDTSQHCVQRKHSTTNTSEKWWWSRGSGGQSGLKVSVWGILTRLNACYLVGKRVSFKSRFHKIPALYKENSTLHIPQKNNGREGLGVYRGWKWSVEWYWREYNSNCIELLVPSPGGGWGVATGVCLSRIEGLKVAMSSRHNLTNP